MDSASLGNIINLTEHILHSAKHHLKVMKQFIFRRNYNFDKDINCQYKKGQGKRKVKKRRYFFVFYELSDIVNSSTTSLVFTILLV